MIKFWFYVALLLLAACAHPPVNSHLQACVHRCEINLQACQTSCLDDKLHCCKKSKQDALKNYRRYCHQQRLQGDAIKLELKSFRDPLQCRKLTCNCPADYAVCVTSCSKR